MTSISFLLFLWMTWMATDDVIAVGKCKCDNEGSCPKNEICAAFDTLVAGTVHYCVEAKICKGSKGGQCPADEICQWTPKSPTSYACVIQLCSTHTNGTCPPGQLCTPHKINGLVQYGCKIPPKVCSGQSDRSCPPGQNCTKEKPHSCVGVILCEGQYEGQCGKDQVCDYEKGPSGSKSWSCRSNVAPCPKEKRAKCIYLTVCRNQGSPQQPSYQCMTYNCASNADCLVGEKCSKFASGKICIPSY